MKNHKLAAFLSGLLPGAGQIYRRDWSKGGLFLLGSMILASELRRNMPISAFQFGKPLAHSGPFIFLVVGLLGLSVWSVIDAYQVKMKTPS
jgi:hypothetical protein